MAEHPWPRDEQVLTTGVATCHCMLMSCENLYISNNALFLILNLFLTTECQLAYSALRLLEGIPEERGSKRKLSSSALSRVYLNHWPELTFLLNVGALCR